ncbi:hypothetical protein [Chryseolinea soli]|uniref:Uncharacterized protein n=1 Tax=Chryseolinea soli TaxID=2321403 RepID=A0A385SWK8_9BACT|nr:hypothetical protein [Chryseolinea soli]AYB34547.1 hypothetical protein D4L85_29950 [Chryseolinea soli]
MARHFFVLLSLSLVLGACTQRLICPAYQSAFIYDKNELRKKFSYFQEDSTPKVFTASKNRYLVAEPVSYRKKVRSLQTVAMKPVKVYVPDSLTISDEEGVLGETGIVPGAELDAAARSVIDSTYIVDIPKDTTEAPTDSVYVITKDKEVRMLRFSTQDSLIYDEASGKYVAKVPKYYITEVRYNVEQDNYMWYLRHNLILPDVRLAQQTQQESKAEAKGGGKKEKKKGGFFKNLFKKKNKDAVDSTAITTPPKKSDDDFDYVDEDEQQAQAAQAQGQAQPSEAPKKKKGLFRKKDKTESQPAEEKPKKKKKEKKAKKQDEGKLQADKDGEEEEDKDDGF